MVDPSSRHLLQVRPHFPSPAHRLHPQRPVRRLPRAVFGHELTQAGVTDRVAPIHVLLAEPFGPTAATRIQHALFGQALVTSVPASHPDTLHNDVMASMQGRATDLLVVRGNCHVGAPLLNRLASQERPAFVLRAGTGMNNLDAPYLDSLGIGYGNTPEVNTQSTAELALALILALQRKIPQADRAIKAGLWDRESLTGSELRGKTLGIIGVGRIGSTLGMAAQALGMRVLGFSPRRSPSPTRPHPHDPSTRVTLPELCSQADIISLHIPLTEATRGLIGRPELELLAGRQALIVNTARGGIIDEQALLDALNQGLIAGAAIDVFVQDPAPAGSVSDQLARHPRVIATPHLGGQTTEACLKMEDAVIHQARTMFLERATQRGHRHAQ